ncbi:hypothetical protein [Quisquiliibacterium transsilvanicum]|uniref:Twin-arginine translocation signal domain-containing protein n=1 Tax=Quisquiliibacterium transsilvanicum TaxID=1549638 RepID=A0A7W8HFQ3_9BURK|nr:hypothetical protein [Quisquiliibacterium transsilvanicum]MBB5271012.1 hypothetical protein [Quisquiliibacterium transsilvanicum]
MTTRRTFLKAGLLGGALLAVGGFTAVLVGRDPDADRRQVLLAVIPAVLDGALPDEPQARAAAVARCAEGVDTAIAGLPPAARAEAAQLFALLAIPPSRIALAGVRSSWDETGRDEVAAFLERWRQHPVALMRSGYGALHDLTLAAWYADESTWESIGYPGPLNL